METNLKQIDYKGRVNYIKHTSEDGKVLYTGESTDFGCACHSWESVKDLEENMKITISAMCEFGLKTIQNPLDMKECNLEEWEAKDDNIDYWEIERMKRLLKRPTIQAKFKGIIETAMLENPEMGVGTQANDVINALINQKNK